MKKKQPTYSERGAPINRAARRSYWARNKKGAWSDTLLSVPSVFPLVRDDQGGKVRYRRLG